MFAFDKNSIIDAIDLLSSSNNSQDAWNNAVSLSESWGASALNIALIDVDTTSLVVAKSSMSNAWLDEYVSESFYETDPLIRSFSNNNKSHTIFSESSNNSETDELKLSTGLADANYKIVHGTKTVMPSNDTGKMVVFSFDDQSGTFDERSFSAAARLVGAFVEIDTMENRNIFYSRLGILSAREIEVLSFLAQGHQTTAISYKMKIAEITVNKHFFNAKRKLGAKTREEALFIAMKYGYISL